MMNKWSVRAVMLMTLGLAIGSSAQTPSNGTQIGQAAKAFGSSLKKPSKRDSQPAPKAGPATVSDQDDGVLRVETDLVVSDVVVLDKSGVAVKGLNRSDFDVKEDGQAQAIEVFSSGHEESAIPRSIVLIIDYSGSQLPYIETSIDAAKTLVDMLNPGDRIAIVTDNVELVVNFTSDKTVLKEKLEQLKVKALEGNLGKSRQYSALMAAINELFHDDNLRPVIIFQTDGDELSKLKSISKSGVRVGDPDARYSYEDILEAAEKTGTTVYTIIPGMRFDRVSGRERIELAQQDLEKAVTSFAAVNKVDYYPNSQNYDRRFVERWVKARLRDSGAVAEIARRTGGWTEYLERPEQASAVYSRILAEMNKRYVIGYYPTNTLRDGKRRKIKITLLGDANHRIRGRTSYLARDEKR